MSSFTCKHCGTDILDTPAGYITGCEHYPIEGKKMKAHFSDDEYAEEGICGHTSENIVDEWKYVTCKKCLAMKGKYLELIEKENKYIAKQMGDFVDFCNTQEER
jgi:hypothetical protein